MSQQVIIPAAALRQLADLLEEASRVARALSAGQKSDFSPIIPRLERPDHIPEDEQWFWSEAWQQGEREANKDLRAGRYSGPFDSAQELIADLHRNA